MRVEGEGVLPGQDEAHRGLEVSADLAARTMIRSADRTHVPDMEALAINQRPKTRDHRDPRLYRYEATNLYQWYSKTDSEFLDPFGEPFVIEITPERDPVGSKEWMRRRNAQQAASLPAPPEVKP